MGFLICSKCKSYYELGSGESVKDFVTECDCGGKLRYVENLDIVDPHWKQISFRKKSTKKEIITNKVHSIFSLPRWDLKNRLTQFYHKIVRRIDSTQNQRRINRNPYGMDAGLMNSIANELNLHNIRWALVIPVTVVITIILVFTPGILTLLNSLCLLIVGYLFEDRIIGTKNAIITGAISFFLGSLFTGSFLLLIPYTILGIINGAVCGWVGGYLKTKI